ncbi:hypothetical protein GCM10011390_30840 [Aureimonas endophytica]|uniref:Pilus formation protein N-terminal domain-containing protein n=1 Tax=Aureimonas endophytica TaxID=2027858 RepID=A0A916ZQT3_9HYPH|nr:pilus assembly protein N-terminal domain-containing protein [Aureimonas endophytica]GGE09585.1 hypothetical protein GCM10011390_30840 [Aureimonas endophytica]
MFRAWFLSLALANGLASAAFAEAAPQLLSVDVDHASVLKVPRPAATVIIGNPAIADVTVQDATTMVLTGRAYGITNLIVLDGDGQPLIDEKVAVRASEEGTVRIYRQAERQTYACMPECEPTVTVGDTEASFNLAITQHTQRQSLATAVTK